MNYDLFHEIDICQLADVATQTSTLTTSAFDVSKYEAVDVILGIGASGDTLSGTVYWTIVVHESDTYNASFAAAATGDVLVDGSSVTTNSIVIDATTEDQKAYHIGYCGKMKYIRVVATATGTHTYGTPIAVIAIGFHKKLATPTTNVMVAVASA